MPYILVGKELYEVDESIVSEINKSLFKSYYSTYRKVINNGDKVPECPRGLKYCINDTGLHVKGVLYCLCGGHLIGYCGFYDNCLFYDTGGENLYD